MTGQAPEAVQYRAAIPEDAAECVRLRGKTRQNPVSEEQLLACGVTIDCHTLAGDTGEIQVLVVMPEFEGRGIGRELLRRTTDALAEFGHRRLFLGCSPDPASRSHGFYRHLGWRSTGNFDQHGDEILEIFVDS